MSEIENSVLCFGTPPTSRWRSRHIRNRNNTTLRLEGHEVIVFTLNLGKLKTRELWRGTMIRRPKIVDTLPTLPTFVSEDLRNWGMNLRFFGDVICYNMLSASK